MLSYVFLGQYLTPLPTHVRVKTNTLTLYLTVIPYIHGEIPHSLFSSTNNINILQCFFLLFSDDLLSNDPPNKENPYKSYFTQIGSARPIRGLNFRTPIVRIKMDWDDVEIR